MTQKPFADGRRRVARSDDLESLMTTGQAYNVAALYFVCHRALLKLEPRLPPPEGIRP
jgi:hypothetical protein